MNLKRLLLFFFFISFVGCQKSPSSFKNWMSESGKIKVLSTIAQIGDLVSEIGGERVDSWVLIQGALDPHSYELVKGDGEKFERADLVFYNGLGLEHGASLSSWLRSNQKAKALGELIFEQYPNQILYKANSVDPHIWMDISLWQHSVDLIAEFLVKQDFEGADYYWERARVLKERMSNEHRELLEMMHRIPSKRRYLVTSHDAFHYFTRAYLADPGEQNWSERFAAPEGLAPDGQLSSADIQNIITFVHKYHIRVLFPESNVSRDSIRKILISGAEIGLSLRICEEVLYGDAMDGEGLTYLAMMRHNVEVIASQLERE